MTPFVLSDRLRQEPDVTESVRRLVPGAGEAENWADWRWQLNHSVTDAENICQALSLPRPEGDVRRVVDEFVVTVTPYYLNVLCRSEAAYGRSQVERVAKTFLPSELEIAPRGYLEVDGMGEEGTHPRRAVSMLYPDRALLFVANVCPIYCRYCFRKRKVGHVGVPGVPAPEVEAAIEDIARLPSVRDVIISGGDPLMLSDERLVRIVDRVAAIEHVGVIRIDTKFLAVLPQRFTRDLVDRLVSACRDKVLHLTFHFVHPMEVVEEVREVGWQLAARGILMNAYIPLLRDVNDDRETLKALFWALARAKIRPYYLVQNVTNKWNLHFQVPVKRGLEIVDRLTGEVSGIALPQYIAYLPRAGGKAVLSRSSIRDRTDRGWVVANHRDDEFLYYDPIESPR